MVRKVILRLRINLEKSQSILVGRMENLEELALEFGCKVGVLPFSYLGLPLGALFKFVAAWDGMERGFAKTCYMHKTIYFQRWKAYLDLEHLI